MPRAKNPPRIEVSAMRMRWTKVTGGDWDDHLQKVQLEVKVRNLNLNKPVDGLRCEYWVLAESLVNRSCLLVIDRGEFDIALSNLPDGREMRREGKLVTLQWDDTGAIFGQRFKGYLVVVTNADKELVTVKTNTPSWERIFERAFDLRTDSWCDRELMPAPAPRR